MLLFRDRQTERQTNRDRDREADKQNPRSLHLAVLVAIWSRPIFAEPTCKFKFLGKIMTNMKTCEFNTADMMS